MQFVRCRSLDTTTRTVGTSKSTRASSVCLKTRPLRRRPPATHTDLMTDDTLTPAKRRENLREEALAYHEFPTPGKLSVTPSKKLTNQHDLALAYSPGVAIACEEIVADPLAALRYTTRGNLIGVIT